MKPYKLVVFDLDGTLYRGEEPIDGAVEAVRTLAERGAQIGYLTNNSANTVEFYVAKLGKMGFPAQAKQIVTSSVLAASYLAGRVQSAFVVGGRGLFEALEEAGIRPAEHVADAVVAGIDKAFTYEKLNSALQVLRNPDAFFVATNTDATYPLEGGMVIPGAGAIVASIATAASRSPFVCGKPQPAGVQELLRRFGCDHKECLVVGDRYETDIEAGKAAGCDVHLVLSGVTSAPPEDVAFSLDLRSLV